MTYKEHVDSCFALLETVCMNYDYEVMTEAAEGEADSEVSAKRSQSFIKTVFATIKTIIKSIRNFLSRIVSKIRDFIARKKLEGTTVVIKNNKTYHADAVVPNKRVLSDIQKSMLNLKLGENAQKGSENIVEEVRNALKETRQVKEGDKLVSFGELLKIAAALNAIADKASTHIDTLETNLMNSVKADYGDKINADKMIGLLKAFKDYSMTIANDIYDIIFSNSNTEKSSIYDTNTAGQKADKRGEAKMRDSKVAMGESASILDKFAGMSNSEIRAHLLIEAADALKDTNVTGIEGGEGTQKEIDEIPEEKPVETKEYPEDTSGGEGKQDDHMEDVKELVDGDKKAIDILTDDEGSEIITENVFLNF